MHNDNLTNGLIVLAIFIAAFAFGKIVRPKLGLTKAPPLWQKPILSRSKRRAFVFFSILVLSIPFLLKVSVGLRFSKNDCWIIGVIGSILLLAQFFFAALNFISSKPSKICAFVSFLIWPLVFFRELSTQQEVDQGLFILMLIPNLLYLPVVFLCTKRRKTSN